MLLQTPTGGAPPKNCIAAFEGIEPTKDDHCDMNLPADATPLTNPLNRDPADDRQADGADRNGAAYDGGDRHDGPDVNLDCIGNPADRHDNEADPIGTKASGQFRLVATHYLAYPKEEIRATRASDGRIS